MPKNKITVKLLLLLVSTDILETFTHFCFKKSALLESGFEIARVSDALIFVQSMLSSGFLWVGLASVAVTFVIWSTLLSKIDLSIAVPICSFSYILVPLASMFFLNEKISALRWSGIAFVLVGVIFVSMSHHGEEEPVR
jgi:drug/metabolite transporter (DMT)-like permease